MKIPRTTKSPVLHAQLLCYLQNAPKHVCTLTIKLADGKLQAYTCFINALQSFLASIEKSTSLEDITKDQLEDLFLNAFFSRYLNQKAGKNNEYTIDDN